MNNCIDAGAPFQHKMENWSREQGHDVTNMGSAELVFLKNTALRP
jgi:hypothetical protein